nr:transcriptional regulator [Streptomyces griseomycini]
MSAQDDVARFAALLRELKERTDRSYGSLARRLSMNTSTLHRYCAGEAVPVDFAPVERFAALCGASGGERLELHRRWLLAAAARQRPRPAVGAGDEDAGPGSGSGSGEQDAATRGRAGGGTPGTADGAHDPAAEHATVEEPVAGCGVPDGPHPADARLLGATAVGPNRPDGTAAPADAPNGPATAPDAENRPATAPGTPGGTAPAPRTDGRPAPRPDAGNRTATGSGRTDGESTAPKAPGGPGVPAGAAGGVGGGAGEAGRVDDPVVEEDVVSGPPAAGGRGRPWYRRRERVAVALAAACALLATVGSLSALPDDGRRSPSAGDPPPAAPGAAPATDPAAPRPHAPSPAPSASASAAPDEGPAVTGAPRRPSAPAAGPAAPADSAPAGPPLTWTADSQVWEHGCGHDYVIARPPEQVPPPPAPQDAGTWAATQSAVHGGETTVALSVQGTSDTAVVLTALRVRVVGRGAPAPGNAYAMDQGCGGALTPRHFAVDLDKDRPLARAVAGNDAGTPVPAVRLPYRVSATDPEVLLVTARTGSCDCRWHLELDWSSRGRTGTVRVDDHGRPFRTSGTGGLPRYAYDTSTRRWAPRAA